MGVHTPAATSDELSSGGRRSTYRPPLAENGSISAIISSVTGPSDTKSTGCCFFAGTLPVVTCRRYASMQTSVHVHLHVHMLYAKYAWMQARAYAQSSQRAASAEGTDLSSLTAHVQGNRPHARMRKDADVHTALHKAPCTCMRKEPHRRPRCAAATAGLWCRGAHAPLPRCCAPEARTS